MNLKLLLFLLASSLVLAACRGGEQPLRIAAFPAHSDSLLHTVMVVEVTDINFATQRVKHLVSEVNATIFSQYETNTDGQPTNVMMISVPGGQNAPLRAALARLGSPVDESRSQSPPASPRRIYPQPVTTIELYLRQSSTHLPPGIRSEWRPLHSIARAFATFQVIFNFLIDLLVWLAFLISPFILAGWIIWALLRRLRNPADLQKPPGS